ncbi:MAG: hypothetical protein AAF604_13140 [Acidobacteriota bacterium]
MSRDDFYIGYQPQAPPSLGRYLRRSVIVVVALTVGIAGALTALQGAYDPGTFEFGEYRTFEGRLRLQPYPHLEVPRPGSDGDLSRFGLVPFGKAGVEPRVAGLDGQRVRLSAALLYREGITFLELADGDLEILDTDAIAGQPPEDLGEQVLRGEIVDSKCFLGTMKPGRRKPHRACAALCIRGGAPPLFTVEDTAGRTRSYFLTDEDGGAINQQILDRVAEPLEVTGRVQRHGDLWTLAAPSHAIRRLE